MAGIQTSVWSTLITPVKVVISTPLVGREIDFSSPILQQMWDARALNVCLSAGRDGAVYGGVPESGILPATLDDTHVGSWFIPATAQIVGARPSGISDSYSMIQQGFTADVSCTLQDLTNETFPAVSWYTDSVASWKKDLGVNGIQLADITWLDASSDCVSWYLMNITDAYFDSKGNTCGQLDVIQCQMPPIITATGNYTDITGPSETSYLVCQIAPTTSVVSVDYSGGINVALESVSPPALDAGGAAGFFAMYIITDLVWHQQAVNQLLGSVGADKRLTIVEQYLQGVAEYSASILRACLSAQDLAFIDGAPSNITKSMSGTWNTQTLGWKDFSTGTTLWLLIPVPSTVTDAKCTTTRNTFDPSNPLHLMAAAAAGGSIMHLEGLGKGISAMGEKLTVVLARSLAEVRRLFVQMNTHPCCLWWWGNSN
ncbi:hypothetical protein DFH09DRAFT_1314569 [Mycena vulgaris]|nr:hypothetical protein DFH09DRAFT_1314569 [Mycena vulgaris]